MATDASPLLRIVVSELRQCLLAHYREDEARALIAATDLRDKVRGKSEEEKDRIYRQAAADSEALPADVVLSLRLWHEILRAYRDGNENKIFGAAGERGRKHRAATQKGAARKLENDPKQVAKARALELWKERHAGQHPKLRTVEQFATEVMRRWPVLTSPNVIRRWSAEWTKAARAGTL
ncbi:MAG: hypothetical protein ACLGHW_06500 [Gammaproteobacteria bacterium]